MENLIRLISTTSPELSPSSGVCTPPTAPARPAPGFLPRRVQCQQKCYSDISLLLSITCRLFTARIKYILCSGEVHCTGVSGNSLSFLLQNKTVLTSVRFAVNNPSALGTERRARDKEEARRESGRRSEARACPRVVALGSGRHRGGTRLSGRYLGDGCGRNTSRRQPGAGCGSHPQERPTRDTRTGLAVRILRQSREPDSHTWPRILTGRQE